MLPPVWGSLRSTVTFLPSVAGFVPLAECLTACRGRPRLISSKKLAAFGRSDGSSQTRTWYRRGFGHSIPARRMTAPARPLPETSLFSATDASPPAVAAPGKTGGARTSTAGSRNLSSATSMSCSRHMSGPPSPSGPLPFCPPRRLPPRADVSTAGGCERIAHTSSSRYATTKTAMMTSHPTSPCARTRPPSSGWKKAVQSLSIPRVNAFTRLVEPRRIGRLALPQPTPALP